MILHNLSFRYKIPLRASVLMAFTAAVVTAAIMYRVYDDLKEDLFANAASMGRVLAHPLTAVILHDDVWRTYEIINAPFRASPDTKTRQPQAILVLDAHQKVYVSTQPKQYPILSTLEGADPELTALRQAIAGNKTRDTQAVEVPGVDNFYIVSPIVSDNVGVGTLVMSYSKSMFLPRFLDIARSAIIMTLLALAAVLPITWYWAWRMSMPLTQLAECMAKVGATLPDVAECKLYVSEDEIGQVGAAFGRMLNQLRAKEALEERMLHSERLAAVGRLTAGIAHEINNPLGGMLNAITTFKKHGENDPQTVKKTISLIERGLLQIKDTIAALLVEARLQSHPLTTQDIEDTRTLVLTDARSKSVELVWENDIIET